MLIEKSKKRIKELYKSANKRKLQPKKWKIKIGSFLVISQKG